MVDKKNIALAKKCINEWMSGINDVKRGDIIQTTPLYENEIGERKIGVVLRIITTTPNISRTNIYVVEFLYNGDVDRIWLKDPHSYDLYYVEKVKLNENLQQDVVQALRDGTLLGEIDYESAKIGDKLLIGGNIPNVQCRMIML